MLFIFLLCLCLVPKSSKVELMNIFFKADIDSSPTFSQFISTLKEHASVFTMMGTHYFNHSSNLFIECNKEKYLYIMIDLPFFLQMTPK